MPPLKEKLPDGTEIALAGGECLADFVAFVLCMKGKNFVKTAYYCLDSLEKVLMMYRRFGNIEAIVTGLGAIPPLSFIEMYYNIAREYERMALNFYGAYVSLLKSAIESFVENIIGPWAQFPREYEFLLRCAGAKLLFDFIESFTQMLVEKMEYYLFAYKRGLRRLERAGKNEKTDQFLSDVLNVIRYIKARIEIGCASKLED